RLAGAAQDTLILESQHLVGALTVLAPNITVRGAVQSGSLALAASAWVNIEPPGRLDASAANATAGSIAVSADVFVNSGQLPADGPTGGHIDIQARNILNGGPITADSAAPGVQGGQVHLAFTGASVASAAALLSASSASGPGGQVSIDGGSTGHLFS